MASQLQHGRRMKVGSWALVALCASGCVTVYEPLVGLQRPVAIDAEQPGNFDATTVLLRCHAGENVEADVLCRNLRSSLTKQGATVTTEVVKPQRSVPKDNREATPEFIIDLTSKLVSQTDGTLSVLLCIASFTLIPATLSATYAQELTVRDQRGFLLGQLSLQERFVESFGLGVWAINGLIDLIDRPKSEQVTGEGFKAEFTKDLHAHLAQLLHNARVKTRVLNAFEPVAEAKP